MTEVIDKSDKQKNILKIRQTNLHTKKQDKQENYTKFAL